MSQPSLSDESRGEGLDILSKLSASLLHQMMQVDEPDTRRFVAAVGGDRTLLRTAARLVRAEIATVSFARLTDEHFFDITGPLTQFSGAGERTTGIAT